MRTIGRSELDAQGLLDALDHGGVQTGIPGQFAQVGSLLGGIDLS